MHSDAQLSSLALRSSEAGVGTEQVIRNLPPAEHKHIPSRTRIPASMGCLDGISNELLFMILDLLDFQSLSRLSRVCSVLRSLVEHSPAYRDMMAFAPQTLTALGRTGLLSCHAASQLSRALRSSDGNCASCRTQFGGYLFLPTCERACFDCLRVNLGLRVTTFAIAKECFRLSDSQLKGPGGIPTMLSIPGDYSTGWPVRRNRTYRLVCVKQAKQLAIDIHGSIEAVQAFRPPQPRPPRGWKTRRDKMMAGFHDAPLESPGCEIFAKPVFEDDYGGMAAIRFPFLDKLNNQVDFGNLCLGCQKTNKEHINGVLPARVLASLGLQDRNPNQHLHAMTQRLWSKRRFPHHVEECYGAQRLLRQWENTGQPD